MADFIFSQTDAQLQAIMNKIQPLATTGDMATLGFGHGECETAGATAAKTVSMTNTVLTPGGIIRRFSLRRPIYGDLAAYGHMGREELGVAWEKTNKVEELKACFA